LVDLESRTLLSTWLHPVGGDWDDPTNWSGGRVPGRSDDAFIPFHGITVTHVTTAADTVRNLNSEAAIDLSAGSLAIGSSFAATVSRIDDLFTVSGGTLSLNETTLNGRGSLKNFGTLNFGTDAFSGECTINVAVDNEGVLTDATTVITNDAARPFVNGPNATLRVVGNSSFLNAFTNPGLIDVRGDVAIGSGTLVNAQGAAINLAGSLHANLDNQGTITSTGGLIGGNSNTVTNEGTITVGDTGRGGSVAVVQSAFTNSGTITLTVSGSTFAVNGGTFQHPGTLAGPGTLVLANITTTLTPAEANAVGSLSFRNSTITSTVTLTNLVGISGSTINANVVAHADLGVAGNTTINGSFTNSAGVTVTIAGIVDQPAVLTVTRGLTNSGSIVLSYGGDGFTPTVAELTVTGGTLLNQAGATIAATAGPEFGSLGPRLLNAQVVNQGGGMILIDQGTVLTGTVTNSGVLNLRGDDLTVSLTGSAAFTNRGIITVASERALVVEGGGFVTTGFITLSAASGLVVDGNYSQDQFGSRLDLNGGVLTVGGLIDVQRGTLAGPGVINGNVNMDVFSTLEVGGQGFPGVLTINGNYTQSILASMVIRIANTTPGLGFDQLNITGQAALNGSLRVNLILGFVPDPDDSFTIMTFGSMTGSIGISDGGIFTHNFDPNDITLVMN
jgi:hypothetical protein